MKLKGDEYCCDCGNKLDGKTVRARIVSMGEPEQSWESASRMPSEEMPIDEQVRRAGIAELVCPSCYASKPGLEAEEP